MVYWALFSIIAPLLIVSFVPTTPYVKSNSVAFAQRINAVAVFAIVLMFSGLNLWLFASNKDASTLPGTSFATAFFTFIVLALLHAFPTAKVEALKVRWRRSSFIAKWSPVAVSALIYYMILGKIGSMTAGG